MYSNLQLSVSYSLSLYGRKDRIKFRDNRFQRITFGIKPVNPWKIVTMIARASRSKGVTGRDSRVFRHLTSVLTIDNFETIQKGSVNSKRLNEPLKTR